MVRIRNICIFFTMAALVGCVQDARRPAMYVKTQRIESADPELTDKHCPFGQPKGLPGWNHGDAEMVSREGYVLLHGSRDKIPFWVCEYLTKYQLTGDVKRPDPDDHLFQPDPQLDGHPSAKRSDYRGSGFDRGHQAPAGDQTRNLQRKIETFYLSNIAPQVGNGFNRRIWRNLEGSARNWIKARGNGYVITGPMFYDPEEEDAETADGWIDYKIIGNGSVAVPTHFYKIIVAPSLSDESEWEAIGFVLENKYLESRNATKEDVHSIDWIEEHTGFNFMPDLDPLEERKLEREPSEMW